MRALYVASAAAAALFISWHGYDTSLGAETFLVGDRLSNSLCPAGETIGQARIVDGDTIKVHGRSVRLDGVAAPEIDDRGGQEAADYLRGLLDGQEVRCQLDGQMNYNRCVGICFVGRWDIGRDIIRAGLARDCSRFSGKRYREDEFQAKLDGADIGQWYELPDYCAP